MNIKNEKLADSSTKTLTPCICLAVLATITPVQAERVQNAGLYSLWVSKEKMEAVHSVPCITGGQVVVQWGELEPQQGQYDFSPIDEDLQWFADRNRKASLQVNGNRKPQWLFSKVPYYPEKLSVQVNDEKGSLMYWHPVHRDSYLNLLKALAVHLRNSAYKDSILGIRLNFNPFGTEHWHVTESPAEAISLNRWIVPPGVDKATVTEFNKETAQAYLSAVVDTYVDCFSKDIRVFVRNTVSESIENKYRHLFQNGTLSWFHTSSEAEPRAAFAEIKYRRFYDDCRSGKTTAYAEPWASAWGHHGGKTDDRWCSPPQWMYWRLLNDLHCGVSFIGIYASDLNVAIDGTYASQGVKYSDGATGTYRREFSEALEFAAKYAGYHASPQDSPGAWIAFRENNTVLAANGMPEAKRKLTFFNTDYTFLMERVPGDKSFGEQQICLGPDEQRFGAWTRRLPAGEGITLKLNRVFASSLSHGAVIKIIYCDLHETSLKVSSGEQEFTLATSCSGVWETALFEVNRPSETIRIEAGNKPLILHMVEVNRNK